MAKESVQVLYNLYSTCLLKTKAAFKQAALAIGIRTVDNFNKVLLKMTKHAFTAYAFYKQKRYLCRHLAKPRSMKLRSFNSRLQELNASFKGPADEIMDIIYNSMPTSWKNKMIEQGFKHADSTVKK